MTDIPTAQDEEHWGTCLHEAGHLWASHQLLGDRRAASSVRAGAHRAVGQWTPTNGNTIGDPSQPPLRLVGHPLDGMDPAERQRADRWLVMLLIGDEAETLSIRPPSGGWARPTVPAPPPALPADIDAVLVAAESRSTVGLEQTDGGQARKLAVELVGPVTAGAYIAWATLEARQAVCTHSAPIHALASALWREPIIDGQTAAAILERSS